MVLEHAGLAGSDAVQPADANGLLRTALVKSQNPTIFFAHERLMDERGQSPTATMRFPLVKRPSNMKAVMSPSSPPVSRCHAPGRRPELGEGRISAEVVDPRTLEPLDRNSLFASVKKTGRVVVTDESHDNCSVAAGLAAIIADEAFASSAPDQARDDSACARAVAVSLEDYVTPTAERIVEDGKIAAAIKPCPAFADGRSVRSTGGALFSARCGPRALSDQMAAEEFHGFGPCQGRCVGPIVGGTRIGKSVSRACVCVEFVSLTPAGEFGVEFAHIFGRRVLIVRTEVSLNRATDLPCSVKRRWTLSEIYHRAPAVKHHAGF